MDRRPRRGHRSHGRFSTGRGLQYDALNPRDDEIRVLHLRFDASGRARHRLETIALRRSPRCRFAALSYTWGSLSGQDAVTIRINGREVDVSRNLGLAIDDLCDLWFASGSTREPLRIWIDQLCIDQSNEDEKRQQIRLMDLIYTRARNVFVWLPPRRPLVYRQRRRETWDWDEYAEWHHKHMFWDQTSSRSRAPFPYLSKRAQNLTDAWKNVQSLVTSKWWSRAWVYQEFLLAGRAIFLIDGFAVQWQELTNFLRPFFDAEDTHLMSKHCQRVVRSLGRDLRELHEKRQRWCFRLGFQSVATALLDKITNSQMVHQGLVLQLQSSRSEWKLAREILQRKADRDGHLDLEPLMRLSTLMSHSRKCQSSWDRDKVYSVLGLTDPDVDLDIPIEYPEDAEIRRRSDVELLIQVAAAIMESEQCLNILAIPSSARWDPADQPPRRPRFPHRLPSWAPDWFLPPDSLARPDRYNLKLWEHGLPGYRSSNWHEPLGNAGGNLQPVFSFPNLRTGEPQNRILRARALYVFTLGHMMDDIAEKGWNRHVAYSANARTNAEVDTTREAQPGDQVWVVLGCNKPLTLRSVDRSGRYRCILGPQSSESD